MTHDKLTLLPVDYSYIARIANMDNADKKLPLYLLGWCVADAPVPSDELTDLCIKYSCTTLKQIRYVWVKHIVCKTTNELNTLMKLIMSGR